MTYIPEELRQFVIERAKGCCEYCLLPYFGRYLAFEIEHNIPEKHRGRTIEENLSFSCFKCNRHKGSDFASFDPATDELTLLFNPRTDQWSDHFRLNGAVIAPLTPQGRVTEFLLKLNSRDRVTQRTALIEEGVYPCQ